MDDFAAFIDGLDVPYEVQEELRRITPQNYTGLSRLLVDVS